MIATIFFIVYIISVILSRFSYRLCSSKHFGLWMDEDCRFTILWIIPIVNSFVFILMFICIFMDMKILNNKLRFNFKSKVLNKILNRDL
jgi:hypothetical protein